MGIKEIIKKAMNCIADIDFISAWTPKSRIQAQKKINEAYQLLDRLLKFWEE